jgi:hypothetical protein
MLDQLARLLRRATGLHGNALGNAATSMRANRRAREHRETVDGEVRDIELQDRDRSQPVATGRSPRK